MAGRNAQGSRILHNDGGTSGQYVEIENVTDISGPNGTAAVIDVTDLRSTAKESVPGLADYGQIQLTINWRGATEQVALYDMFSSNADPEDFRLALPTSSAQTTFDTFDFLASVTQCTLGAKVDDKQTAQITLKTSGSVVLAQNVALASLAT